MVGPDYSRPPVKAVDKYSSSTQTEFTASLGENSNKILDPVEWWTSFIASDPAGQEALMASAKTKGGNQGSSISPAKRRRRRKPKAAAPPEGASS